VDAEEHKEITDSAISNLKSALSSQMEIGRARRKAGG
jgi:hypothetical protein